LEEEGETEAAGQLKSSTKETLQFSQLQLSDEGKIINFCELCAN
jgi:hypothetical protein